MLVSSAWRRLPNKERCAGLKKPGTTVEYRAGWPRKTQFPSKQGSCAQRSRSCSHFGSRWVMIRPFLWQIEFVFLHRFYIESPQSISGNRPKNRPRFRFRSPPPSTFSPRTPRRKRKFATCGCPVISSDGSFSLTPATLTHPPLTKGNRGDTKVLPRVQPSRSDRSLGRWIGNPIAPTGLSAR